MYELSEPKRRATKHNRQDCTGNVHHGFSGGGAHIVGFDPTNKMGSCNLRSSNGILAAEGTKLPR